MCSKASPQLALIWFVFLSIILLVSCGDEENPKIVPDKTIFELIEGNPDLTLTETYIEKGHILRDALDRNSETWTYFAPTDDAWVQFMEYYDITLINNVFLLNMAGYHAVPDQAIKSEVLAGPLTTLWSRGTNKSAVIDVKGSALVPALGNTQANILINDSVATNGVLHIIDAVLLPSYLVDMKDTNAELICLDKEMEFFYKGIISSEIYNFDRDQISFLGVLAGEEQHTVFATADMVFRSEGASSSIYTEQQWYSVLGNRFIRENIDSADLVDGATFTTYSGNEIKIYVDPANLSGIYIDWNNDYEPDNPNEALLDARILDDSQDRNSNGSIYFIDTL